MVCAICNDTRSGHLSPPQFVSFDDLEESAESCGYCQIILSVALAEGMEHGTSGTKFDVRNGRDKGGICYLSDDGCGFFIRDLAGVNLDERAAIISTGMVHAGSDLACDWTRQQIETCKILHHGCNTPAKSFLPDRVIALGTYNADTLPYEAWLESDVKLHESPHTHSEYAALSHCWGEYQPLLLLEKNIERFKTGIELSILRRAFRRAIIYARKLGISYIWIDSLCIIQDSNEDWYVQSGKMASIYEGATVTIAAATAHDSETDCFTEPSLLMQGYVTNGHSQIPARGHDQEISRLVETTRARHPVVFIRGLQSHEYPSREPCTELPLLQRGWVYQERLLSPRIIYFGSTDVMFECNSSMGCYCENLAHRDFLFRAFPLVSPIKAQHAQCLRPGADLRELSDRWMSIVEEYSKLSLTIKSDRLPAIAGVAKQFARSLTNQTYLSGLWEAFLVQGMTWSASSALVRNLEYSNSGYPSWSWVPVPGPIDYEHRSLQAMATVQRMAWNHASDQDHDGDEFLVPKPCAITLFGVYIEAHLFTLSVTGRRPKFELRIPDATDPPTLKMDFVPDALELESEWGLYETVEADSDSLRWYHWVTTKYGNSILDVRQLKDKVGLLLMGTTRKDPFTGWRTKKPQHIYLVVRCQDPLLRTFKRVGLAYEYPYGDLLTRHPNIVRKQAVTII